MLKIPKFLMPDLVTIKPYSGQTAKSKSYNDNYNQRGKLEEEKRVYKDDKGVQLVSEATFTTSKSIPLKSILTFDEHTFEVSKNIPVKAFNSKILCYEVLLNDV